MSPVRLLLLASLAPIALFAQRGDRQGETQSTLPPHLAVPPAPTLDAENALKTFQLAPGFKIEIAAADPLVHDPVAMTFGPDGRIWVVEMKSFMLDADGRGETENIGSVAVLEDTDGDGRADKRTTFLSGLVMPRAIALVDDGVLVAEPPRLWFCRDTNGDGVADEKTEVSSNYGNPANPEHTANGLMWALDNWIYNANHPQRFRYLGKGKFATEMTRSRGQWGISQDDSGRIFHNSNSDPLRADLIPTAYLGRNRFLTSPAGANVQLAPADLPIWPGRVTTGVNRGYKTLNAEGKITAVTAACGPVIYRGTLFPGEFHGNAFFCEPAGNLIKRLVLTESNGTLAARNAYEGAEFLTSTDERFRPVNLANGPDGALYVVDMYRGILQHRIYMTSFLRKQIDERGLATGVGLGRIYRIVPVTADAAAPAKQFDLSKETSAQLVARLREANGWFRDTAQRLLVERRDAAAAPLLRGLVRDSNAAPLAQLHALWTLEGCEQLDRDTVLVALRSGDARVAAAAIRLAEKWISSSAGDKELLARIVEKIPATAGADLAPTLALQVALSLGEVRTDAALAALGQIAALHGKQPFIADAIASGLGERELEFIQATLARADAAPAAATVTLATSAVLKSGDAEKITRVLTLLAPGATTPAWARTALLDGVKRFLPKTPEGKSVAGTIAVEPTALLQLSVQANSPESKRAAALLKLLKWPGKPGTAQDAVAGANRLTPEQKILFEKGRTVYAGLCGACHQPSGEGLPGLAPQLLFSRYVLGSDTTLARIVLNGIEKDGLVMPPLQTLDDESLAAALTFIRQSWGHDAAPVSPATIAKIRREVGSREAPWSDDELDAAGN